MANVQNLKSNSERTPAERRKQAQKAGKASGVSRRRRKSIQEIAEMVAKLPLSELGKTRLKRAGIDIDTVDPNDLIGLTAIVIGQMNAAAAGSSKSAEVFVSFLNYSEQRKKDALEIQRMQKQIERLEAETEAIRKKMDPDAGMEQPDDGFLEALKGSAAEDWGDGYET